MRVRLIGEMPSGTVLPTWPPSDRRHQTPAGIRLDRAEIPGFGKGCSFLRSETFRKTDITAERFEHMLPRADRMRLRISTDSPFPNERTMSGMSRSRDQSPPPITLPARAVATLQRRRGRVSKKTFDKHSRQVSACFELL